MSQERRAYPSDVTDDEWAFCAPYLTLIREDATQRDHCLRELFNGMRYMVRTGCQWRYVPHDFPPWTAVYQQARRWWNARCFETMARDLREMLRVLEGREAAPSAAVFDSRTISSTPESGARAGYDGYKRRKGSKIHIAVDTLGHLLALRVTPANEQDRAQVEHLAQATQEATGETVKLAYVDQGYTGDAPAEAALQHGMQLEVVKLAQAKRGFVLLPRRWVVERSFGWLSRFRRLARDYERLARTLEGMHWLAFLGLLLGAASKINLI
jgi:transposase